MCTIANKQMHFEYRRSVKQEFESSRLWGGVALLGLCLLFIYFYIKTKNELISLLVFSIIIVVAISHFFRLRKLKGLSGTWEIYVTDSEVVWNTPKEFGSGFVVRISEISKYVEATSSLNEYTSHYLELKNGTTLCLNPNVSNFNFSSFSKALINLGVKREAIIES